LSDERLILRGTRRAVAPFGGVAAFISFLGKIGFVEAIRQQNAHLRLREGDRTALARPFFVGVTASLLAGRRITHPYLRPQPGDPKILILPPHISGLGPESSSLILGLDGSSCA